MIFLLKKDEKYTASQISQFIKLDRTTIQKAIKNLVGKKLVKKMQKNIPKGGYTFLYIINDKKEIKEKIKIIIHSWCKVIEKAINEL